MQTVHGNRDTVIGVYWPDAGWLALDTVYTYEDVASATLARYRAGPPRPFFLMESRYENEHGVDAAEIRKMAYGALFSGASGQVYGNNPVWHFDGPALNAAPTGRREALGSDGVESIRHLQALFGRFDWWKLKPDDGRFARMVEGAPSATAISAVADGGSFAVVYL